MGYKHSDEMLQDILTYMHIVLTMQEKKSNHQDIDTDVQRLHDLVETIYHKSHNAKVSLPLLRLQQIFQLSTIEYQLLWMITALEIAGDIRGYFHKLFATKRLDYTFAFVLLQNSLPICFQDILLCLQKESKLWIVLSLKQEDTYYHMEKSITLEDFALGYIIGIKPIIKTGITYQNTANLQFLNIHQELYQEIQETSYCLFGHEGAGKHYLYYRKCKENNQDSMCIDSTILENENLSVLVKQCIFNSLVCNYSICIEHVTTKTITLVNSMLMLLKDYGVSLVVLADEDVELTIGKYRVRDFLNREEVELCMQSYALEPLIKEELMRSHFIIRDLLSLLQSHQPLSIEHINQYRNHSTFFNPYCTSYTSSMCLEGWQGNDMMKEKLAYILYLIKHKDDIRNIFQANRHFLQQSVSVIFHGASGTGKTYAAKALAGELKQRLLIANLAKINDKYIGETEKHLEEIFYLAYKHHCILFFDEADVLFTKRTEVQQANDKYANVSTAYLLQKIENFDGVVILATNLISNFDDAFLRRMQMIVKFETSDKKDRENMYRILCQGIPLDYGYLADLYPFSLARIEQIIYMAYVMASKEDRQMSMEIIKKAMRYELSKQGELLVEKG